MSDGRGSGRTIVFVSHNEGALRSLCSKGIVLNSGRMVAIGQIDDALREYAALQRKATELDSGVRLPLIPHLYCTSLRCDPESVVAGEPVDVDLNLFSEQHLMIREAALLLYSSMGARVAVVDLRAAGL